MQKGLLSNLVGYFKNGFAYDSPLVPSDRYEYTGAPIATSNTAVMAAVTLTTSKQIIKTSITDPAHARALIVKGSAAGMTGVVTITGLDIDGFHKVERFTLNGSAAVTGNVAFSKVYSVELPVKVNVSGDTVSVGVSNKLGLKRQPSANVLKVVVGGTPEAATATDLVFGTYTPTTSPDGTKVFEVYYSSKIY